MFIRQKYVPKPYDAREQGKFLFLNECLNKPQTSQIKLYFKRNL